jgi:DNA-binding MarR family transcriptional regulator
MEKPLDNCLEELRRSPLLQLSRTVVLLKAGVRRAFTAEGHDITPEQWGVLHRLQEGQGLSQGYLAQSVSKDKTTMVRILDSLESRGLVERKRDSKDRRSFRIYLTEEGRAVWAKLVPVVARFNGQVFSQVNERDLLAVVQVLDAITDKLGGQECGCQHLE